MATVGKLGTVYKRTDINSPFYYACFRGRDGKRKIKCTGVQDKRAAMDLLREWESTERRYAEGLRDEKSRTRNLQLKHRADQGSRTVREQFERER